MSDEQNEEKNEEFVPKEKENQNIIPDSRDTKDSIQIHNAPDISDMEEDYQEKCYSMQEGSILGGVFALSSLALGTGAFSIPIRCTQLGLVWYLVFIFAASAAAYWTLTGLIRSSRTVHGVDYSPTVRAIVGNCAAVLIDVIIVIYLFGVFVQYMVIIYALVGRTIFELFIGTDDYKDFDQYESEVWDGASLKYPIMLRNHNINNTGMFIERYK